MWLFLNQALLSPATPLSTAAQRVFLSATVLIQKNVAFGLMYASYQHGLDSLQSVARPITRNEMSKFGIIRPEIRSLLYLTVFWVVLIAAATHLFGDWDSRKTNPNQQLVSHTRGSATEIELQANRQGHYLANGPINNQSLTFILDTGATTVSVSESIAQKAGLTRGRPGLARTAAGTVNVWSTSIQELQLGDITFNNVPGSINPSMDPDMVLLGMSVLGQLNFSQESGVLTLSLETR